MDNKFIEISQNKINKINKIKDNFYQQLDRSAKTLNMSAKGKSFDKKTLSVILFVWFFTIGFYLVIFSGIAHISGKLNDRNDLQVAKSIYSLYKPGIEIINQLKRTKHLKYIQRLYIHPKEENKMMIMIKSNYWDVITKGEKSEIILKVIKEWQKIYKNSDSDQTLKPEVYFANS